MSLVERLVSRWHKEYTGKSEREEARWWLNAIADELNTSSDNALEHIGEYDRDVYSGEVAATWLRSQANPDSAENEK